VSHLKERAENNCLNCNAVVHGKYCHICGQENIEPKETVWHLINHFFQDITHFDGKFFSSLKLLVFRPGFLSREYMLGRRAGYLNPIRFYVFTSAIFFLIFFSLYKFDPEKNINVSGSVNNVAIADIKKMDSAKYTNFIQKVIANDSTLKFAYDRELYFRYLDSVALAPAGFSITPANKNLTRREYDSLLAHGKDHNWIERKLVYKQIELNEKYKGNKKAFIAALINSLLHSVPQILFITLPLFALWLKLMYTRRRQYYYVNHAIFTIHLFVFIFILLLVIFGINKLALIDGMHWLQWLSGILTLLLFFYIYKAMRNFYKQGRGKTILKFIILLLFNLVIMTVLFTVFLFLSFFKI
jgi:hypothetical protein